MPAPMPLSGAAAWYSAGSQSGSASSSANRGRITSQASSGEEAPAIVARTSVTNARTTAVSRTNSALTVSLLSVAALPRQRTGGASFGQASDLAKTRVAEVRRHPLLTACHAGPVHAGCRLLAGRRRATGPLLRFSAKPRSVSVPLTSETLPEAASPRRGNHRRESRADVSLHASRFRPTYGRDEGSEGYPDRRPSPMQALHEYVHDRRGEERHCDECEDPLHDRLLPRIETPPCARGARRSSWGARIEVAGNHVEGGRCPAIGSVRGVVCHGITSSSWQPREDDRPSSGLWFPGRTGRPREHAPCVSPSGSYATTRAGPPSELKKKARGRQRVSCRTT